jgi:hypothetical protein
MDTNNEPPFPRNDTGNHFSVKLPDTIYDRITQLVYTLPYKMGFGYMSVPLEVKFDPPRGDYMHLFLHIHPFMFRTLSDTPDAAISDESLAEIVKDHLRKLDTQVHLFFNETDGQFWLKPEHQHLGYKPLSHIEPQA